MTHYDAVLFDQDGVLVDPPAADVQAAATRAAFRAVGVEHPKDEHVNAVVNGLTVDGLHHVCRTYGLDPEAFWDARERLDERSQFERFEAGARTTYDDLEAIGELDLPRGVVSNNHDSTVAFVLESFGLRSLFDAAFGREKTIESLRRKKPNPHYLELGLDALDADDALYVGDGESDVLAAHRAGVDSALLRRSHNVNLEPEPAPTYDVETLQEVATIVDGASRSGE